uniref:Uncharacterized protein n=1 Tax=Acrobeloides nanus TaxID=290746 RepID=A0A914CSC1_9BILA
MPRKARVSALQQKEQVLEQQDVQLSPLQAPKRADRHQVRSRAHSGSIEKPHRGEFGHRKNPKRIQQGKQLASKHLGKAARKEQPAANIE